MRCIKYLAQAAVLFYVASSTATANTVYTGSFSGTDLTPNSAVTSLSGSWSFEFDEAQVVGSGPEEFLGLMLSSLSIAPNPIGGTTFDNSNAFGYVRFLEGDLQTLGVYGAPADVGTLNTADDFTVSYFGSSQDVASIRWSLAAEPSFTFLGSADELTGSFQSTIVPVPAAAWLFASALGLFGYMAKRRANV